MPAVESVLSLIGNTPMLEVSRMDTGTCRLFLKLESQNPGGSIKDRIGRSMIEEAERDGRLKPGGTLIEATAGNTGLALALVAQQKGYRVVIVIPDKMSQEKIFHLKAMGAEVILTRSDIGKGHPDYYQDKAERLAAENGWFYVNQFGNPANPLAHETGTGPEIWAQMEHRVDAVVCGVGSAGTITGLSRFFARVDPRVEVLLADPAGSVLAEYVNTGTMPDRAGSWLVEGIGEDFLPPVADFSRVSRAITIPDREAFLTARELLTSEGVIAGSSSGTLIAAALRYCREQTEAKRVVTFVCDNGTKYLSKMFNDFWMLDQGFIERESHGDLRDLIARPHSDKATVVVAPDDTLMVAYSRMKLYDISQLPVLDGEKCVGIVHESDILLAVYDHEDHFKDPVRTAMVTRLETVESDRRIKDLLPVFEHGHVAIVNDGSGRFQGLITRIDLLNYLRRRLK